MQKLTVFPSGLKLITIKNPAVRSVAIGVFVGAGAVYESPEVSGISHFIEHMCFKGTYKRSAFDIVNEIDCIGAQINAFTAKSYTCYYTVSLDTNAEKCIDVLSDMYFNAKFDDEELVKERNVVLEEISESEDTPDDVCLENLSTAFFAGHTLEKSILGTRTSLEKLTSEHLKKYRAEHYSPANTVLVIAGNITQEGGVSLAEKYFENNVNCDPCPGRSNISAAKTNSKAVSAKKEIEQAHIAFAFPSYPYDDDRNYALQLLAVVFGMEMSSRLFQSVREKLGLCYTITGYPSAYENNGYFVIFTSTNPQSVTKAVGAIRKEIEILLEGGITDEELVKGKEQLKTSLVLGQESTSSMMRTFGRHAIQTGRLYDVNKRIAKVDAITKEDIDRAARDIFDFEKVASSYVGKGEAPDILKLMKTPSKKTKKA